MTKLTHEQMLYLKNKHKDEKPCKGRSRHGIVFPDVTRDARICPTCGWRCK